MSVRRHMYLLQINYYYSTPNILTVKTEMTKFTIKKKIITKHSLVKNCLYSNILL